MSFFPIFSTIFCWRPQLDHFLWDNKVSMSYEKWIIILLNSVHPYLGIVCHCQKKILLCTPKRNIIFFVKKLATELPIAFLMAITSTHLVNSLVATNIHVHHSEGGFIGPMKFSPQLWKTYEATIGWRF